MMKNQKGITLVALIITIIVMLILAGVSISLVVGENGVLTQAQDAGDSVKYAEGKQAIELAGADLLMQYYGDTANVSTYYGTTAEFEDAIEENGNYAEADVSIASGAAFGTDMVVTIKGVNYTVSTAKVGNTNAYKVTLVK